MSACYAYGQKGIITGQVSEKTTGDLLIGVNVIIHSQNAADSSKNTGTTTDFDGNYYIEVAPGSYVIDYQYVGYKKHSETVNLTTGSIRQIDVLLSAQAELIDEVVVSAGKFEQKLSEVTVSMEILKPQTIENSNDYDVSTALNKIPGVDINNAQPSIRSSSGWSYGAGSRVIILMDDLPIMSADVGDVKWNYIPVENISQIEVVKGASSALFGSSAIGGVINVRSAYPKSTPETKINYFIGTYDLPKTQSLIWWDNGFFRNQIGDYRPIMLRKELFYFFENPMYSGISFSHGQQFGNLDLTMGGNHFVNEGYRYNEYEYRTRGNINLRYRSKKIKGLAFGINSNFMAVEKSDFFFWHSDTAAYLPNPNLNFYAPTEGYRTTIDPFFQYFKPNGSKYSIRTRYFRTANHIWADSTKDSKGDLFYGEYQYQTTIREVLNLTAGANTIWSMVTSRLFGEHYSSNFAGYAQLDWRYGRLKASLGLRAEYFRVDTAETVSQINLGNWNLPIKPVMRMGLNYELGEYTFLRASYGQGYRFPAIAEKYTATSLGGGLNLYPNPQVQPETGWSTEIGIKQGFNLDNKWQGYIDASVFLQQIDNMIEFTFGFVDTTDFSPVSFGEGGQMGFQARNMGDARIFGSELSVNLMGQLGPFETMFGAGYTYTNPINRAGTDTTYSTDEPYLKYRYLHSFKGDVNFESDRIIFGFQWSYHSSILNVDRLFSDERDPSTVDPVLYNSYGVLSSMVLPGYWDYRIANADKGFFELEARFGFKFSEHMRATFIVKNLFNAEQVGRPADMLPPRRFEVQFSAKF
jgi:iron complex outermembrane receptor protein